MNTYDGWEPLMDDKHPEREKILGRGGQGVVYLARSPQRAKYRTIAAAKVREHLIQATSSQFEPMGLARYLFDLGGPEPIEHLGALKHFDIPKGDKDEEAKAIGRLESEIHALKGVNHPAVIKLLHSNVGQRFIVTEFHPYGTLAQRLNYCRGNVLAALSAFKSLVDGVAEIHKHGAIHRDVKTENIFVTTSGGLVLGDFGIVFFQEGAGERLTTTYERVGSHFWMAPWAYDNARLELSQVNPALDIYPLAKVLWSMISGKNGFPFWEYDRETNNLELLFPDDPSMPLVNSFLGKCIVREEKDCRVRTTEMMGQEVENLIHKIKEQRGLRPEGAKTWPCRMCGKGTYYPAETPATISLPTQGRPLILAQITGAPVTNQLPFAIFVCDNCGHAELFKTYYTSAHN